MGALAIYLAEMARIQASGEASDETSYYPALSELLNTAGGLLNPIVHCVLTPKNRGCGIPDGALYLKRSFDLSSGAETVEVRAPERGVVEVKPLTASLKRLASSKQVAKYLARYRQVLITNYREFQQLRLAANGEVVEGESFELARSAQDFWQMATDSTRIEASEVDF